MGMGNSEYDDIKNKMINLLIFGTVAVALLFAVLMVVIFWVAGII